MESVEDLEAKIAEYEEQQQQIQEALDSSPDDESLQNLLWEIKELIQITADLLECARQNAGAIPSVDYDVSESIFEAGSKVQAQHRDGRWFDAIVETLTSDGKACVKYEGLEIRDVVTLDRVKPREALDLRKRTSSDPATQVESTQRPEHEPEAKRRKPDSKKQAAKAAKKVENPVSQRQQSWQHFLTKAKDKPLKVKKGGHFVSTAFKNKESIFKSPESVDGKVGVTGSGKKMTDFQLQGRFRI